MKKLKIFMYVFVLIAIQSKAQDPNFSQFFSSPLNINPALTANINADWRAIANFRDQWISPASLMPPALFHTMLKCFRKNFLAWKKETYLAWRNAYV
jgi:hypothetical protein